MTPTLLLSPVIGFDISGYRLGYGGGFYDRTLAALTGPRVVIGIGFDCAEIPSIGPHGFDMPMDRIVTESGFRTLARMSPGTKDVSEPASPACDVASAPNAYMGYLTEAEVASYLKALRTLAGVRDKELMSSFDSLLQRLPMSIVASAEPTQLAADASIVSAIESVRPRIRNDALHDALGDVLQSLAKNGETPARRSTTR